MHLSTHRRASVVLAAMLVAELVWLGTLQSAGAQGLTEFPLPNPNNIPTAITTGPDGALWFIEEGRTINKVGRITTTGAITEYPLPNPNSFANLGQIVTGPDGALWFTEGLTKKIGRITTAGVISEFAVPPFDTNGMTGTTIPVAPFGITAGPDGALWFTTDFNSPAFLGRITTNGVVTLFRPLTIGNPKAITAGPDGALWFTDYGNTTTIPEQIGRITIDGSVTTYPLSNPDSFVPNPSLGLYEGIALGPDGALWFPEDGVNINAIGRITTEGTITEYPVPNGKSLDVKFSGITAAPDGALWFTEIGKLGRISTAGVITELNVAQALTLAGDITAGPDGALWLTEPLNGRIARFSLTNSLTVSDTGIGTVTSSPAGINCPGTCSADFPVGTQVSLTESPGSGLIFIGWGGACSGTGACTVTMNAGANVSATFAPNVVALTINKTGNGAVTSSPVGIDCGSVCSAGFAPGTQIIITENPANGSGFTGWGGACSGVGNCVVTLNRTVSISATFGSSAAASPLRSAVLPSSRSVTLPNTATAFATIINTGNTAAPDCTISPTSSFPGNFVFQTTDLATNALLGTANTPVDIAAGTAESFVIALTPSAAISPADLPFSFACANIAPAPIQSGLNTLLLSASTTPVPDIVALAATTRNDGVLHIPGASASAAFAVATVNVGALDTITASANAGSAQLPLTLSLCQTDPASGSCLSAPSASATTTIGPNQMPTFGIFGSASGSIPFDPANSRIFIQFRDSTGTVRGSTSVAVTTQ